MVSIPNRIHEIVEPKGNNGDITEFTIAASAHASQGQWMRVIDPRTASYTEVVAASYAQCETPGGIVAAEHTTKDRTTVSLIRNAVVKSYFGRAASTGDPVAVGAGGNAFGGADAVGSQPASHAVVQAGQLLQDVASGAQGEWRMKL